MKLIKTLIGCAAALLLVTSVQPQTPDTKHFDKDGLSFDYPAKWQMSDQSTQQMQFIELTQGDVVIRVRSAREWLKTPEKEAHAKLIQDDTRVSDFAGRLERQPARKKRSPVTANSRPGTTPTGPVAGRSRRERPQAWADSYYPNYLSTGRLICQFVDHRVGKETESNKAAATWETIRLQ